MVRRLIQVQYRGEAGVGPLEDFTPLITGFLGKNRSEFLAQLRPGFRVVAVGGFRVVAQTKLFPQQCVETRLQRPHRNIVAVSAQISVVPVRTIEPALPALVGQLTTSLGAEQQILHMGAAIDDRRINDLAFAGIARVHDAGEQTYGQVERTTAHVAHQTGRRNRCLAWLAGVPQRTSQCDVIHVMPGGLGQRTILAPTGHAAVDQARVARQANIRSEAQALHHAGTHAFDQGVTAFYQAQYGLDAFRAFEINSDGTFAALIDSTGAHVDFVSSLCATLDQHHISAKIGKQHSTKGSWPKPRDFKNLEARQRPLFRLHSALH
ncbi:hypothetical protein D3C80_1251950 [compost metagenome]